MNAARHNRLDKRPQILVLHPTLELVESGPVRRVQHGLVLQVALPTLVTNGAVQRMVQQQELQHGLPSLLDQWAVGIDLHVLHHGHRARCNWLGGALNFDQAHAAVAGNGEGGVVAEARYLSHPGGKKKWERGNQECDEIACAKMEGLGFLKAPPGASSVFCCQSEKLWLLLSAGPLFVSPI